MAWLDWKLFPPCIVACPFFSGKSSSRTLIRSKSSATDGLGLFVFSHATIISSSIRYFCIGFFDWADLATISAKVYVYERVCVDWCHSSLISIFKARGRTIQLAIQLAGAIPDTSGLISGRYSRLQRYPDSINPSDPYLGLTYGDKRSIGQSFRSL